jgi:peptide/nickel transport system permease protein
MNRYILQRLALVIPTIIGASLLTFMLIRLLPGDIVDILMGGDPQIGADVLEKTREALGLNLPFYLQYWNWITSMLRGDMGSSLRSGTSVGKRILESLPVTLQLAFMAIIISCMVAIPLGILSAVKRNSPTDIITRIVGLIGLSFPGFWLATMFLLISSTVFKWTPPLRWVSPFQNPWGNLQITLVPAIILAVQPLAVIMRMTRASMLEVLGQDYIRTAAAKGLSDRLVLFRHALRNAVIPVLTVIGIQLGGLIGGSVIIEQIFSLPGVAFYLLSGIYERDYPVVQGTVLFLSVVFVVINLAVDLLYGYLDPRIRHA